ncbi:MAG: serine protease [Elusimicrobia bacterium]|nr:serine protease [Elusimicrobiota bacterium]
MKNLRTTLGAAALLLALPFLSFAWEKGIYGRDDRLDHYAAPEAMKALADSVVSLWDDYQVEDRVLQVRLLTRKLGEVEDLCPGERFREQPEGAGCSGALVGPDLVLTAGHCVRTLADCRHRKIVFGYAVKEAGVPAETILPANEVYSCAGIVKRYFNPNDEGGPDFALLKLDRKVTGHRPLPVNRGADLKKGDGVFVIGYPQGMPVKIAGGATVRDFSQDGYFVTDLDSFKGNSGSPVFNARTRKIEGVLVRGDVDTVPDRGRAKTVPGVPVKAITFHDGPAPDSGGEGACMVVAVNAQNRGRGEDVTKISELLEYIPVLPGEKTDGKAAEKAVGVYFSGTQAGEVSLPFRIGF